MFRFGGVFQGQTNLAITAAQESDMLKNVELVGSPGGDLREMAVDYVTAAGLGTPRSNLYWKNLGQLFCGTVFYPSFSLSTMAFVSRV